MAQETVQVQKKKAVSLRSLGEAIMPKSYFVKESRSWLFSWGGVLMMILIGTLLYVHLLFVWYIIDYFQIGSAGFIKSPYLLLSRFNGQFAILFFSIEFILATRTRFIEKLFGGFDRVYKMHALVGRVAMLTAILHFVFILANTPIASGYFFDYILPNSVNSILFGQIAFWGFIALVAVSVWIKLPYSLWLWTHKVIGVAFLLSGFHVWLIQPAYAKFDIYHTVFTVVWVLGMISWIYKLFLYKFFAPHHNSVVTKVEQVGDVVNLFLQVKGGRFASRPGDFVFISLVKSSSKLSKENHPFSISGLYDGNVIRLSIKDLGDYTHIVSTIQPGDEVIVYGPYGKFDDKLFAKKSDMVWIGGGIGIAPFAYMAQYFSYLPASGAEGKRKALLFHTVKTPDEALYADEFEAAHQKDADFTYQLWDHSKTGFLTAAAIIEAVGGKENLTNRLIFMCGPLPMMHALSKQFLALGMHPRQIVFEEFTFG